MVGRVLLCTRTTACTIKLTNKGATGPEGAIETTISVWDNKGKSSELSPVDKLLLVEWGGFFHDVQSNKTSGMWDEQKIRQRARKQQSANGKILFFPTEIRYTRPAIQPCYLSSKHTIGPGAREGKTDHNTVVEKGTNGNAMVDDRRTSILSGTETELANEVIRKHWEQLNYYNSTDNARLT